MSPMKQSFFHLEGLRRADVIVHYRCLPQLHLMYPCLCGTVVFASLVRKPTKIGGGDTSMFAPRVWARKEEEIRGLIKNQIS